MSRARQSSFCPKKKMRLDELFQSVITSDIQPRKAVKKTIALMKKHENHNDFFDLLLFILDAKKETANLAIFFRFLTLFFEALNTGS